MKKLVHTREISVRTNDLGDHTILVKGNLVDHRYRPGQNEISEKPELVHPMVIRLKVKGPGMLIEQAEAKMPHLPREECPHVLPCLDHLEGLEVAPGSTAKAKKVIGGVKGYAHYLSSLEGEWSHPQRTAGEFQTLKSNSIGGIFSPLQMLARGVPFTSCLRC